MREESDLYPSRLHKIISIAFRIMLHCGVVAMLLWTQYENQNLGGGLGIVFLTFAVIHIGMLLGFIGPKAPGRVSRCGLGLWVPDPAHDSFGCLVLLTIGLVHFFGVAVIDLRSQSISCTTVDLESLYAVYINGTNGITAANVSTALSAVQRDSIAAAINAAGCDGAFWRAEQTLLRRWTVVDRVYFCFVLMTTVGYGNSFSPSDASGRSFALTFSLCALLVFGAISFALSSVVQDSIDALIKLVSRWKARVVPFDDASGNAHARTSTGEAAHEPNGIEPPPGHEVAKSMFLQFLIFIIFNYVSAFVFKSIEDGWTFSDAIYHCIMTATTIGLGDIAPHTQGGRVFAIFHMSISVALFAAVVGAILSGLELRKKERLKAEMLRKQLDEALIMALDKNGDGVDKAEFVLGMLEVRYASA